MNPSRHLSYANVASTLAVVLALGGGGAAVAAGVAKNSVGSKQIKAGAVKTADLAPGAVDSSKVADGSLTGADLTDGAVMSADVADGTLGLGDLSTTAKDALSQVWDPSMPLPSGRSVTGSVYYTVNAGSAGQALPQSIALPALAPVAVAAVNFAPDADADTTDDDPLCTGTYDAPSAPAGRVCLYGNVSNATANATVLAPGSNRGFVIRPTSVAVGSVNIDISWAYTAP